MVYLCVVVFSVTTNTHPYLQLQVFQVGRVDPKTGSGPDTEPAVKLRRSWESFYFLSQISMKDCLKFSNQNLTCNWRYVETIKAAFRAYWLEIRHHCRT